jgi:rhomboid protease GluP
MYSPPEETNPSYPPPPPPSSAPGWVTVKAPTGQPVVVYTLMGITIFVYLLQLASPYLWPNPPGMIGLLVKASGWDAVTVLGMKVNELIIQGQLWRLVTPMFLHASLLHIGFNMYALLVLGRGLEIHYGHNRFLVLYLLSGFAGNVLSFIFSPAISLGASTAVFGLLAAEGVFLYQNRQLFGANARPALINVIVLAAVNLFIGLLPGIDYWGHLGGLICGVSFAWFAGPKYRLEGGYYDPSLVDQRGAGDTLRAGLVVFLLFAILAGVKIYLGLR